MSSKSFDYPQKPYLAPCFGIFDARRLWSGISKRVNMVVVVINTKKQTIVSKNGVLHQGKFDADFDTEYWSYDIHDGKQNIRFVLRKI